MKKQNFQLKLDTFTKLKERILSPLAFLVMKAKKNIQSMYQKNVMKKNMLIYYCKEKKLKGTMFLSSVLIHLCMTIYYTVQKNNFCCYCLQAFSSEKILKPHIKDCLKIKRNKGLRCLKKRIR